MPTTLPAPPRPGAAGPTLSATTAAAPRPGSGLVVTPQAARLAARWVTGNPHPLCQAFTAQPAPSAYWCGACGWNRPMHDDDTMRAAIAAELAWRDVTSS